METLDEDPNPSPQKRQKTKTLTQENPPVTPSAADKGKAPVSDDTSAAAADDGEFPVESRPQSCGICFAEEGRSIRGLIDCCSHYYCFLCIIEWSKIESRCPLCRGRFSSVRRVRKDGSFIGEGAVRVPVRDQFYDPLGDPVEPYALAKCTVCETSDDESLLLLCDLCDSASHTYCIGLGATVPEGDWYCRDCALFRAETERSENDMDDKGDASTTSEKIDVSSTTSGSMSILNIVKDPEGKPEAGVNRLLKLVSQRPTEKVFCSPTVSKRASNVSVEVGPGGRHISSPQVDATKSGVRTLQNCRDVHRNISVLRKNWNALRSGTLRFSSDLLASKHNTSKKGDMFATSAGRSCGQQSVSSIGTLQPKVQGNSSSDIGSQKSYNVDRAWKLMNLAKSKEQNKKAKSAAAKRTPNKVRFLKAGDITSECSSSRKKELHSPSLKMQNLSLTGNPDRRLTIHNFSHNLLDAASPSGSKYQRSQVHKLPSTMAPMPEKVEIYHDRVNLPLVGKPGRGMFSVVDNMSACSPPCGQVSGCPDHSATKLQSTEMSICCGEQVRHANVIIACKGEAQISTGAYFEKANTPLQKDLSFELSKASNENSGTVSSTSKQGSSACTSYTYFSDFMGKELPECPIEKEACVAHKDKRDDEAKGEILSLVKLNLKLLTKNKRLGADAFKEIARVSTHTILAACGFDHRKIVHCIPTVVCSHHDQMKNLQRSTLMPSSCRECFYIFVKDVVDSILSENLNAAGVAC